LELDFANLQFLIDPTRPPLLSTNPAPNIKAKNENYSTMNKSPNPNTKK